MVEEGYDYGYLDWAKGAEEGDLGVDKILLDYCLDGVPTSLHKPARQIIRNSLHGSRLEQFRESLLSKAKDSYDLDKIADSPFYLETVRLLKNYLLRQGINEEEYLEKREQDHNVRNLIALQETLKTAFKE